MTEEQQELLSKVYSNYTRSKAHPLDGKYGDTSVRKLNHMYPYEPILSQEEFIDKIKKKHTPQIRNCPNDIHRSGGFKS